MKPYKYEIFTSVIEEQIRNGAVKENDRLPSVREIRKTYRLSTSSVQSGFEYLLIRGLIKSSPRSGYFVAAQTQNGEHRKADWLPPVVRNEAFMKNMMLTSKRISEAGFFNAAAPGDLLIPQKLILRTMQEVIREKGASLLRYYPSNGLEPLRYQIAKQMNRYGCLLNPDELIITDGALQSLTIALKSVTKPGDIVAVDSPCVFSVLEVITNLELKVVEIPVSCDSGFDLESFRTACEENDIRALVVTPNFHNPTGTLMGDSTKKDLLNIAENYQVSIIENDMYSDLYFGEKRPYSIKSFDTKGLVMMYSSFSKTLAPGIRLGWLYAGDFYSKAERVKFSLGRSVSPVYQELILKLLQSSSYERHLRTFRRKLNDQAVQLSEALENYFPSGSCFYKPEGGYSIWGKLPEKTDMELFYQYCEKHNIMFTPGETFSFSGSYSHYFRIIFSERITTESISLLESAGRKAKELLS